jgi:hypothetical protein
MIAAMTPSFQELYEGWQSEYCGPLRRPQE